MRVSAVLAAGLLALALTACGTQPLTASGSATSTFDTKVFDFTQIAPFASNTANQGSTIGQNAAATGGNNAFSSNLAQVNQGTLQQNGQGLVPVNVGNQTLGPNVGVNVAPQIGVFGSTGYIPTW